jgi:ketosteroid isomerase-like protein
LNKEGCVRLVRNLTESEKDQIKLKSLNSKKRKWKSVLYAIILSVAFGLFIKYEGGYTKQALQEEFIAEYVDNSDGTVTHTKTGLIWQRCSVGQTWGKNTCEGDAEEFTWDEAVKFATNNAGWRLPTNAEMINLIHCSDNNYEKSDEGEYRICATNKFTSFPITVSPTINSVIFPYTPKEFFWSPTESGKKAWGVGFYTGLHGTHDKDYKGYIRLVRNVDTTANAITVESNNESISGQSKNLDMIDNNPPAINGLENVDDAEQPQHYMGKDQVTEDYLKQEIQDLKKEVEQLKQETEKNNLKIEKSNIAQLSYLNLSSDNLSIAKNVEQPPITTEVTLAEQSELKQLSQNWIIAHSSKDITLFSSLYDDFILFYGTKKNRNSTLEAKLRLFKKFPDLQQQIYGDIQFEKQTDGTIKGDFTKRVRVTITQGITDYPAYLIFKKSNNGWKIAAESDLQTDKNIAKKSNTSDVDSVVD